MSSARSDARAEQSPRPAKGAASTEIKALNKASAMDVCALKKGGAGKGVDVLRQPRTKEGGVS